MQEGNGVCDKLNAAEQHASAPARAYIAQANRAMGIIEFPL